MINNGGILEYKIWGNLKTCQSIKLSFENMWSYFLETMPCSLMSQTCYHDREDKRLPYSAMHPVTVGSFKFIIQSVMSMQSL